MSTTTAAPTKNNAGETLAREKFDALLREAFQRGTHGEFSIVIKVADGMFVEVRHLVDQGWRLGKAQDS